MCDSFLLTVQMFHTYFILNRKQSNAIREKIQLDSKDTDLNTIPNHYITFTPDIEIRLEPLVSEEDHCNDVYSEVEKKRRSDQLSNNYDHVNYKGYDHLHSNTNPRKCYGQYDTVEIGNCKNDNETLSRNGVRQTSNEIISESDRDKQYINPYVDEAVIKGMVIENELRRSLASSIDFDESIQDMMTHAKSWAEEENSGL